MSQYRRALLKISGEAMAGERGYGFDREKILWIAGQIASAQKAGHELGIVIGGGNIVRGRDAVELGLPELAGDHMGMLATVMNGIALRCAAPVVGARGRVPRAEARAQARGCAIFGRVQRLTSVSLLSSVTAQRWSSASDMVDGIEELGLRAASVAASGLGLCRGSCPVSPARILAPPEPELALGSRLGDELRQGRTRDDAPRGACERCGLCSL